MKKEGQDSTVLVADVHRRMCEALVKVGKDNRPGSRDEMQGGGKWVEGGKVQCILTPVDVGLASSEKEIRHDGRNSGVKNAPCSLPLLVDWTIGWSVMTTCSWGSDGSIAQQYSENAGSGNDVVLLHQTTTIRDGFAFGIS